MEYVIIVLIAIGIGLLVGLITANREKAKLKTVARNNRAAEYIVQDSMRVDTRKDMFLYREVERHERPKQDNQRSEHR